MLALLVGPLLSFRAPPDNSHGYMVCFFLADNIPSFIDPVTDPITLDLIRCFIGKRDFPCLLPHFFPVVGLLILHQLLLTRELKIGVLFFRGFLFVWLLRQLDPVKFLFHRSKVFG